MRIVFCLWHRCMARITNYELFTDFHRSRRLMSMFVEYCCWRAFRPQDGPLAGMYGGRR